MQQRIPEPDDPQLTDIFRKESIQKSKNDKGQIEKEFAQKIKNFVGNQKGIILDIGCGCRPWAFQLAESFPDSKVIGIDIDKETVETAKKFYKRENLEFKQADIHKLSDYDNKINLITCIATLHHFNDLNNFAKKVFDILRPRGIIYIEDFDRTKLLAYFNNDEKLLKDIIKISTMPFQQLKKELKKRGIIIGVGEARMFSYLASYTPQEIETSMKNNGLVGKTGQSEDNTLYGYFSKP